MARVVLRASLAAVLGATCAAASAQTPAPGSFEDRMARGKLEADLGHHEKAAQEFLAIAQAVTAPPALRAEASVRLGAVRRASGDHVGAAEAFDQVWHQAQATRDGEMLKLLVQALGEAVPGPERWERVWPRLSFSVDRSDPKRPVPRLAWPDVPPRKARAYSGHTTSIDFKDGDLNDVFRLFADITKLNVVVHPGSSGRVSVKLEAVPWDQALDLVLAPNGLAFSREGNVVRIGRPEQLGDVRQYTGARIDVSFTNKDLREVLASLGEKGGVRRISIEPGIQGRVTLKLDAVPWDQALDVVARIFGLEWSREGDGLVVKPRPIKPAPDRKD
jgi:hypothetical protein